MRNIWLIMKREYVERVRTRAFLVLTLLLPGIMTVLMALPAKLATMGQKAPHLVIVVSTQQFGETVRQQLLAASVGDDDDETTAAKSDTRQKPEDRYVIDIDANPTEAERAVLRDKVSTRAIDGYLWLNDDAIAAHKITWYSRIVQQQKLARGGMTPGDVDISGPIVAK